MQFMTVEGIDPVSIKDAVGDRSYAKGLQYARQHAAADMEWDEVDTALRGTVLGSEGRVYTTAAYFALRNDGTLRFHIGDCDCPVGLDCKHAAALALTASGAVGPDRPSGRVSPNGNEARRADPGPGRKAGTWERSLDSLLEAGRDRPRQRPGATVLAVELTLSASPNSGSPERGYIWFGSEPSSAAAGRGLQARLVQPGKTGWVAGQLSWGRLDSLHYYGDYDARHVRVLRDLYALYLSRTNRAMYYPYQDKTIDLAAFDSPQMWALLDEATAAGVRFIHHRKKLGAVEMDAEAELRLDATAGQHQGSLAVTPVLWIDGAPANAQPATFIGTQAHGVVYVPEAGQQDRASSDDHSFQLARLTRPVPQTLQRMTLEGQHLEVPADAVAKFRGEYYPRLRHLAPVVSSDESFTPPTISDPTLVLHASYGAGHDLDIEWEWSYDVGDSRIRAPVTSTGDDDGYRDATREQEVLMSLGAPLDGVGMRSDGTDQTVLPHANLGGLDTMRFTTEALPLLRDNPDVAVEVEGEPADYREATDSLRIGVSTDEIDGETDWFDLGVTITVEGREVPFADVFTALASDEPYLLLADGAYFSLEKPELRQLRSLIEEARALQDAPAGSMKISRYQAGLWEELTALGIVDRQADTWRQQVDGLLALDSIPAPETPAGLSARLRPYQHDGFTWLAFLWRFQLGGILADDMGLGKTLQSLALICHAKQSDPDVSPFLIVAPTSVVATWSTEAERFASELTVAPICDTLRRRGQKLDEIVAGADVVVTSYTLFRLDFDAYAEMGWSGLLLDEAQSVKNHQSKTHQCTRRLAAPFKLAITGTPMENNLMELWSLLSITAPGLFPNPTRFREHYARPIEKGDDAELLGRLRHRVKPLMKRRTKELVAADLPAKQEQVLEVELEARHAKIYQRHLQRERQKILGLIDDVNRNRFTILRSLTLLRQLSLHAGLVEEEHKDLGSGKIDALLGQLRDVIHGGHRALIFSQFTGFLAYVREALDAARIAYCYLDGNTRNRASVVREFKDGSAPVFLISLKAGGFGLNLTEADYCFLLDPWWNPATETQAIDRTHRIGQTRNVMVYRLIAKDTIEEKVLALAERKAELFSGVMDDGNVFGSSLDAADIRELLS